MPSYARLFEGDGQRGRDLVAYLGSLGAATAVERWELTAGERIASPADSCFVRTWGRLTFTRAGDWHHWTCAIPSTKDAVTAAAETVPERVSHVVHEVASR